MRISDWSSDVCSSDLLGAVLVAGSPYPVYRLVVMAISLAAIAGTFMLFFRTRFGLAARAVIANRSMASCLGIDTRRLDRWTFAVGAGLAGLDRKSTRLHSSH